VEVDVEELSYPETSSPIRHEPPPREPQNLACAPLESPHKCGGENGSPSSSEKQGSNKRQHEDDDEQTDVNANMQPKLQEPMGEYKKWNGQ
jgi:hypothetical protein